MLIYSYSLICCKIGTGVVVLCCFVCGTLLFCESLLKKSKSAKFCENEHFKNVPNTSSIPRVWKKSTRSFIQKKKHPWWNLPVLSTSTWEEVNLCFRITYSKNMRNVCSILLSAFLSKIVLGLLYHRNSEIYYYSILGWGHLLAWSNPWKNVVIYLGICFSAYHAAKQYAPIALPIWCTI